jgi:CRP-like cAMP-binding protein
MQNVHLLAADPDLATGLGDRERRSADRASVARTFTVRGGDWDGRTAGGVGLEPQGYGLLLLSGVLCRRVAQGERCAAELIGPGDLIRPWDVVTEWSTLPVEATWTALLPTQIAVLDRGFSSRMAPYPAVAEQLVRRALLRSRYLAVLSAIAGRRQLEVRLHMLFWHLADRFGRMRGEWIDIPVPMTHSLLADMVAARRPSVSTAVNRLQGRGILAQRPSGWRLSGTVPPEYQAIREASGEPSETALV